MEKRLSWFKACSSRNRPHGERPKNAKEDFFYDWKVECFASFGHRKLIQRAGSNVD